MFNKVILTLCFLVVLNSICIEAESNDDSLSLPSERNSSKLLRKGSNLPSQDSNSIPQGSVVPPPLPMEGKKLIPLKGKSLIRL